MKIELKMSESDIVRSVKNTKYSPIQLLAARYFKEDSRNVEADYDKIFIWNDEINDYHSYRYCTEDISNAKDFLDHWYDYVDGYLTDFDSDPLYFCVEQTR
jgi:hypothetical protein